MNFNFQTEEWEGFLPMRNAFLCSPPRSWLEADDVCGCRMLIGWWVGWNRAGNDTRNGRTVKQNFKYHKLMLEQHKQWFSLILFFVFNIRFHFSFLHVIISLSFSAGSRTNNNTGKSGPQTGCNTYFVHCFHLTSSLQADRQALEWSGQPTTTLCSPINSVLMPPIRNKV